ncbi:MAG: 4Fe-4S binding protein [Desulfobacterales bacterium]|nr:MAG: 4Fe-4S binding protein [Desulfobacterales bacterium]
MKITATRRICQIFFFVTFLWFCVVATLGEQWWQLRGWPVNWIIQLDPLVGLGTLLSTHTLYAGLLWGLATIILTILLGRFFCGWICPFGSIHQFVGFWSRRRKTVGPKVQSNRYHPRQSLKYWILIFLLCISLADLMLYLSVLPRKAPWVWGALVLAGLALITALAVRQTRVRPSKAIVLLCFTIGTWLILNVLWRGKTVLLPSAPLQIGLLDPIPLLYRSVNLIILPLMDRTALKIAAVPRYYDGTWLIGMIFLLAVLLNMVVPRFYCRFVCPLGALFGVLGRWALWRIGKTRAECIDCHLCERNCEGACAPSSIIRINECVLCLNCVDDCRHGLMGYGTAVSATGEIASPDLSRRAFVMAAVSGAAAIPLLRINGNLGSNWNPQVIRPPGALAEKEFLSRCIKCGQCMRVCPTNVIHPAGLEGGIEGLWTPVLNFRAGTSGCQLKCIACGNLCPTAAIRPLSLDERLGVNRFVERGPIKLGTAFVDRGRCLPWAMDRPCIVCQENCPVSPKAIFTREYFSTLPTIAPLVVKNASPVEIEIETEALTPDRYATGDFYCRLTDSRGTPPRKIVRNSARNLALAPELPFDAPPAPGSRLFIQIRLQQPYVDPERCVGCGVCEHECPVPGRRAIRVTADNETRNPEHTLLLRT